MGGKRRKIATDQRRETREQRSVTFTKRRQGLFNKAAELCLFCGAQVAIVVSSPCSENNLYSFGHSSVDAVFDAFLEGRTPVGAGIAALPSAAVSLYEEIKAMECEPDDERRKRRRKSDQIQSDEFWREFEVLEKNCESVEELQALVDNLENFKEKALNKLVTTIMSSDAPSSSSNLFNSADAIPGSDYIFVDENNRFPDSDSINFDENYVADFGTVTDSTSDILDSFNADDEYYNELVCSFFDINPEQAQDEEPPQHIEPVTVSEFGQLISCDDPHSFLNID